MTQTEAVPATVVALWRPRRSASREVALAEIHDHGDSGDSVREGLRGLEGARVHEVAAARSSAEGSAGL